ncbi:MarR family transcriptional regulator [Streptomyces sp. NBC_01707]|jgi:DNA-binding MarR family transcriptional regulator|uniref:MarR family winged helix-turn-helix transcriptional regulator n=1 Tax=unclassified Streptomyces TaxID=2593676 RepID=UPI0008926C56|nr:MULTISPECIES: MarR family transcriptional regulator [unclassified Streptomyces]MDX3769875.1 MarR family transcriptional regulator [Streptomyces sp. AK08-01B]MDX3818732.1 MarR family transcriptional regulator [Streptomyces sp. AK08-01A]SCY08724.1 DNA-binding transcriptional regulator, MarR family [Streptomyces sp. 136MFCol5.1]SFS33329.1 DNA-binding transcriptional regulator, MarR family [Streptomyces sp. ok210]
MSEISGTTDGVSESAARAAREVRVVYSRLRRRMRETYDPGDLTPSQTSVLSRLDKDGEASVSDLAAAERVRHQSVAATVGVLVERGLVARRPDPQDGRRQLVFVTDSGHAFLEDRRRAGEGWLTRALEDQCTEEERRTLLQATALLERIVRS